MHKQRREGDEWACSCGLRWGVDETDPHPRTTQEHIDRMRYQCKHAHSQPSKRR